MFDTNNQPLTFHLDVDRLFTYPIWASVEEVMHVQTLAIPGAIPRPLGYQGAISGQRPTQIAIFPSSHFQLKWS